MCMHTADCSNIKYILGYIIRTNDMATLLIMKFKVLSQANCPTNNHFFFSFKWNNSIDSILYWCCIVIVVYSFDNG